MADTNYQPAPEPYLRTLRALVETNATVLGQANRHIESLGLTPAQFDVIATLGDTPGMTCGELGQRTLITKGTLTGVLDRLEAKGLIARQRSETDSRQIRISLTSAGEEVFSQTFQPHVDYVGRYFDRMPIERQQRLIELLRELQAAFAEPALDS